jgi:hypothetical protein
MQIFKTYFFSGGPFCVWLAEYKSYLDDSVPLLQRILGQMAVLCQPHGTLVVYKPLQCPLVIGAVFCFVFI